MPRVRFQKLRVVTRRRGEVYRKSVFQSRALRWGIRESAEARWWLVNPPNCVLRTCFVVQFTRRNKRYTEHKICWHHSTLSTVYSVLAK